MIYGSPSPSALFPDVVNCMQTDNLELKKLVYLYLMNYAKSQPDMAIMAVNSFVKARPFIFLYMVFHLHWLLTYYTAQPLQYCTSLPIDILPLSPSGL